MQVWVFILSFYIIFLNWYPCTDFESTNNTNSQNSFIEYIPHKHESENQNSNTEDCSPFCICDCCQVTTIHYAFSPVISFMQELSGVYPVFLSLGSIVKFNPSTWHPPALF